MALVSPGVQVTVIDESQYIPASTNSVPFFLIATAQNKLTGSGVGLAPGTLKANANKTYLITSQRDLTATYGNPNFYKTSAGTPINGYELNEYGLLAAYSALGVTNRAYVQRVDIDLTALTASLVRPTGTPVNGTYWLDTANSLWGIFEWNVTTGAFSNKVPLVITDSNDLNGGIPATDFGSIGDYAIDTTDLTNPGYYKNGDNEWVAVGSDAWKTSWPTLQGSNSVTTTLTATSSFILNGQICAVPAATDNDLDGLVAAINGYSIQGVTAANVNDKLTIYADSSATSDGSTADNGIVVIEVNGASPTASRALLTTLGITPTSYYAPTFQQSYNYTVPRWKTTDTNSRPTGSVWNKINTPNLGTNIVVKKYSAVLGTWVQQAAPVYANDQSANAGLDPSGGGKNVVAGSTYVQYNVNPEQNLDTDLFNNTYTMQVFERNIIGATVVPGTEVDPTFQNGSTFTISTSTANSTTLTTPVTATVNGTTPAAFLAAVSAANVTNVSASVNSAGQIVFTQSQGGVIVLNDGTNSPVTAAGFTSSTEYCRTDVETGDLILSAWTQLDYTAGVSAPTIDPADGAYWYYSDISQVDIMIQGGNGWVGYRNETNDVRGYNLSLTDPAGPQIAATAPTTQSDGTALAYGDLWIDSSDLELYPLLYRWEVVDGVDQWVVVDNADQTTQNGILFADARWSTTGTVNPITGNLPTIESLLTSNYLDIDAPSSDLYPAGMLLWNTRRSGYNVKTYQVDYFNSQAFPYESFDAGTQYAIGDQVLYGTTLYVAVAVPPLGTLPTNTTYWNTLQTSTWVNASGNRNDGSPYMGRFAQRQLIIAALKSGVDTNTGIREEQRQFNLLACPEYPELMTNLIALNNERNDTGFVVGDTPLRLAGNGTDLLAWATNNNGEGLVTGDGLVSSDPYAGVFWPSCQTTDLGGSTVVQPPSHMMVRTIIRSDEVSYPWLAPAGTRRGVVDNAITIGYVDAQTGEFNTIGVNQGLRDVLYENRVNPITFVPGVGITNFGNKTTYDVSSALNRINVARLVAFIRGRLEGIGKQFLFEPNDQITRDEIKNAINGLMIDLVAKRGIYDFLVVCDLSNNTPARIDNNELWVDIAIEPVKAVEFIYIPLRLKNTGEIAAGASAVATAG